MDQEQIDNLKARAARQRKELRRLNYALEQAYARLYASQIAKERRDLQILKLMRTVDQLKNGGNR